MKKYFAIWLTITIICCFSVASFTKSTNSIDNTQLINSESLSEEDSILEGLGFEVTAESLISEFQNIVDNSNSISDLEVNKENADINEDGFFDSSDTDLIARALAGWNVTVNEEKLDADGDGAVNLNDLIFVAKLVERNNVETTENSSLEKALREYKNKNGAWATRKPFITFTVDDGSSKDITILEPIFKKYNIPCCPALICGDNWEVNNLEKRLDLQNNHGWEYMCHGVDEIPFNQKSAEQVEAEIVASKTKLEELGFIINDIAYPSGSATSLDKVNIQPIVKKYFRAGYGFNPHPTIKPNTGILNSYNIKRVPLGSFTMSTAYNGKGAEYYKSLEYYKECVDYAVENNAWCVFCLHSAATEFDETQQQYLAELIEYIQSIGVSIGNLTEGYEMFGNYIECGDSTDGFTVTNEGENNLPIQHFVKERVNNTTPLTSFPMNKISVCETGATNASGLPCGAKGIIFTTRFEHYGFQLWFPNDYNYVYKRIWNNTNKSWKEWQTVGRDPNSDIVFSKLCDFGQGFSNSYYMNMAKGVYIRSIEIVSSTNDVIAAEEMVPTKKYFNKSDISTNSAVDERTVLAITASGHKLLAYLSGSVLKLSFVKNDGSTKPNSLKVYVDLSYS